jgi:hypothetical protein
LWAKRRKAFLYIWLLCRGVNLALDEFFLGGVELVVRVLTDGFGEVADEEVPVDDELTMSPWSDFLIPEELIILHLD